MPAFLPRLVVIITISFVVAAIIRRLRALRRSPRGRTWFVGITDEQPEERQSAVIAWVLWLVGRLMATVPSLKPPMHLLVVTRFVPFLIFHEGQYQVESDTIRSALGSIVAEPFSRMRMVWRCSGVEASALALDSRPLLRHMLGMAAHMRAGHPAPFTRFHTIIDSQGSWTLVSN